MNTALHNQEEEVADFGGANGGARQIPLLGPDNQGGFEFGSGFTRQTEPTCRVEEERPFETEDGRDISVCKCCGRQLGDKTQIHDGASPWIGVDLDGTLASDLGQVLWDEEGRPKIGRPIEEMVIRVKRWIANGHTVKIFTARATSPAQVSAIKGWLTRRGLPDLEVTNIKDLNMIELWDDRCVQVATNLGEPVSKKAEFRRRRQTGIYSLGRRGMPFRLFSRLRIFLSAL